MKQKKEYINDYLETKNKNIKKLESNLENILCLKLIDYMKYRDLNEFFSTYVDDYDAILDLKKIISSREGLENQIDELLFDAKKIILDDNVTDEKPNVLMGNILDILVGFNFYQNEKKLSKDDLEL